MLKSVNRIQQIFQQNKRSEVKNLDQETTRSRDDKTMRNRVKRFRFLENLFPGVDMSREELPKDR